MSDWKVGDLALCVNSGKCPMCKNESPLGPLTEGQTYTVAGVFYDADGALLDVAELPISDEWAYCAEHFRKIRPDQHESCEPEFVQLLKRSKVTA